MNKSIVNLSLKKDDQSERPRIRIEFIHSHGDSFEILPNEQFYEELKDYFVKSRELVRK